MVNSNINIRVDKDVKSQTQALFAELGLDLSTAVNETREPSPGLAVFLFGVS